MKLHMLITGGAGFIGSNFVQYTIKNHPEYDVTVLDALTYAGNLESIHPVMDRVEFIKGNVCDAQPLDSTPNRNTPLE